MWRQASLLLVSPTTRQSPRQSSEETEHSHSPRHEMPPPPPKFADPFVDRVALNTWPPAAFKDMRSNSTITRSTDLDVSMHDISRGSSSGTFSDPMFLDRNIAGIGLGCIPRDSFPEVMAEAVSSNSGRKVPTNTPVEGSPGIL
jgi:hypothetical protein